MERRNAFPIGILAVMLMKLLLLGCAKDTPMPLRVGTVVWPGFDNLYLARDLGYYENHPIRLVNYPSPTEQLRAYRNQELEVVALTISDALSLATTHPDLRMAKVLFDSREISGEIVDVLVVSPDVLNSHKNCLELLLKGWFKAVDYSRENPLDAARRVASRGGLTPEQSLKALKKLRFLDLQENQKLLSKADTSLLKGSKRLFQVMLEKKRLNKAVDPILLLDDRLVKNLRY